MKERRGFTLIELLVVMGIVGILVASLAVVFGGASESARATKCRTNMKQLAQACYTIAMEDTDQELRRFPLAGSCEAQNADAYYYERPGWLSWMSKDKYGKSGKSASHVQCDVVGAYSPVADVQHAYTNGAIWKAIDGNSSCLMCPTAVKKAMDLHGGRKPAWCYVMSAYFLYDWSHGRQSTIGPRGGRCISDIVKPDRCLMFAELNLEDAGTGGRGSFEADPVLEYDADEDMRKERMGFPHASKNVSYGFAAFVDSHVETYWMPQDKNRQYELTKWLCQGYDIAYENGKYEKIEGTLGEETSGGDDGDDD